MEEMPSKVLNNLPQGGLTPVFSHVIVALSMTGSDCLRRKIFPLSVTSRQVLFRFVFLSFQRIMAQDLHCCCHCFFLTGSV